MSLRPLPLAALLLILASPRVPFAQTQGQTQAQMQAQTQAQAQGQTPSPAAAGTTAADPTTHMTERQSRPSTTLTITLPDHPPVSLARSDLQALAQTTLSVFNAHTKATESYSGPLVSDVLAKAGLTLGEKTQHAVLDSYVLATGTDGYFVVFSGAELQPGLNRNQAIVALAQAGQPLTRTGAFQLVDTNEVKPARWVRNLSSLAVVTVSR